MKFTVEIDDVYLEEETLHTHVRDHLVMEITRRQKDTIEALVDKYFKEFTKNTLEKKVKAEVKKIVNSATLRDNDRSVTLTEYIQQQFNANKNWRSPEDQISKIALQHSNEMKKRYDMYFSTQIVTRLAENNMLKDPKTIDKILKA